MTRHIKVLLTSFPSLGQTFIAQELLGLERAGFPMQIHPMLRRRAARLQPVVQDIKAAVIYPTANPVKALWQLLKAWRSVRSKPGYRTARAALMAKPSPLRFFLFCKAIKLTQDLDPRRDVIYAHFIRHPATIAQFASLMTGTPWTCCAHARDIWLSDNADLSRKLASVRWVATCTGHGAERLRALTARPETIHLIYHGVDLTRFPLDSKRAHVNDGSSPERAVRLITVGRAIEKKGFDILLDALSNLPRTLHWQLDHIGDGPLIDTLARQAQNGGIADRVKFNGFKNSEELLDLYRACDVFVLPCRVDAEGDMDGLPNVLVEAASQAMLCISTDISAIPEFFTSGENGLLVKPENADAITEAVRMAITEPKMRQKLGKAAASHAKAHFSFADNIITLKKLFEKL